MVRIEDGKGTNGDAEVNAEQQLVTRSITEPELEHASSLGKSFAWDSTELDLVAGETFLFVKNTGGTPLIVDRVCINGSNVVCTWNIGIGSATTTPAGTPIIAVNTNEVFANTPPDAVAFSDETAVADASVMLRVKTQVDTFLPVDMTGVILGKGHYIQVNQETESTSGSVMIMGHFENPS